MYTCIHVLHLSHSQTDIPTVVGVGPDLGSVPNGDDAMDTDKGPAGRKYFIDPTFLYTPREGVEFVSPLKDCMGEKVGVSS